MTIDEPITIDNVSANASDPFTALGDHLRAYNAQHVPPEDSIPLWLFARGAQGTVQGGLRGRSHWGWCFIEVLAVAEGFRRKGIGARLLIEAEAAAISRGCIGMYLTTVAFQAPDFYRKHGFQEFGRLDDFPAGFTHHWFAKRLDGKPLSAATSPPVTPS